MTPPEGAAPLDPVAAVEALERALASIPRHRQPFEHATAAYRLGLAYAESPAGDPGDNLRRALACYEAAAQIFDPRHDPLEHGRVLGAAGAAHRALGHGERALALFREAAALVRAYGRPDEVGAALTNLGVALTEAGCRDEAVAVLDEAADTFDPTTDEGRRGWAAAVHNRGLALASSPDRQDLLRAIADQRAVLAAVAAEEAPYHRASAQHAIGTASVALAELDGVERAEHLRVAVDALRECLTTFTRAAFPFQHALATHNLGRALLGTGDPGDRRRALVCFEAAVGVLDPRLHPGPWRRAHAGLEDAEAALADLDGSPVDRERSFVRLAAASDEAELVQLLRDRLGGLAALPEARRRASVRALAAASLELTDGDLERYLATELEVLMELPRATLELALQERVVAHRARPDRRASADRALDLAVGSRLGLTQRILLRDHLAALGVERP